MAITVILPAGEADMLKDGCRHEFAKYQEAYKLWHPEWSAYEAAHRFGGVLIEQTKYGWTEELYIRLKGQTQLYCTTYERFPSGNKDLSHYWQDYLDDDKTFQVIFRPCDPPTSRVQELEAELAKYKERYGGL